MNTAARWSIYIGVALSALGAGYFFSIWETETDRDAAASLLFSTALDDLEGKKQPLEQWRGNVVVVNFWATWCPPCLKEIPEFIQLQRSYGSRGIQFVGIAVDEKQKVAEFAAKVGINYPVLIGGLEAIELSRKAGNRLGGLPFTLIISRDGKITKADVGGIDLATLEGRLRGLI